MGRRSRDEFFVGCGSMYKVIGRIGCLIHTHGGGAQRLFQYKLLLDNHGGGRRSVFTTSWFYLRDDVLS